MVKSGLTVLSNSFPRFDAFRSIFPAGTVSGAPKIKAIEIVCSLEKERRGVYAGAVGRFDFADDEMDTCIAIRTMTFKNGVAYLQAGGGIVYDSVEEDEYTETLNKLQGNVRALEGAERMSSPIDQFSRLTLATYQNIGMTSKRLQPARTLRRIYIISINWGIEYVELCFDPVPPAFVPLPSKAQRPPYPQCSVRQPRVLLFECFRRLRVLGT